MKDAEGLSLYGTKKGYARYWLSVFRGRNITGIKGDEIAKMMPAHSQHKSRKKLANGTVNRYRTLSLTLKYDQVKNRPYAPERREPKVKVRGIRKWQARELIDSLNADIMRKISLFALLTELDKERFFLLPGRISIWETETQSSLLRMQNQVKPALFRSTMKQF